MLVQKYKEHADRGHDEHLVSPFAGSQADPQVESEDIRLASQV